MAWQNAHHENLDLIYHNSIRDVDRDTLICPNPRYVARDCIGCERGPTSKCNRPAESAGNDEANDGAVEAQREPQASFQPRRQLEFRHQNVDEPRPERAGAGIQRHRHSQEHHGRSLRNDGCDRQDANAG